VPGDLVVTPVLFAIAWVAGFALGQRAVQAEAAEARAVHAEREREVVRRIAVAEERARIARELHDIVAHSVSVMVLQVGAVRHNLPATMAPDREALEGVERVGRSALAEMRRLLGAMRRDGDDLELAPQPGLDGLGSLVEEVTRAGLPRAPAPGRRDVRAPPRHRPVGVPDHPGGAHQRAQARTGQPGRRDGPLLPRELQIEVRDDGRGAGVTNGHGHGLVGVRERVKIYGGQMTAGTPAAGGFVLSTRLPVDGSRR
jgi:signal transduction histidine kinase